MGPSGSRSLSPSVSPWRVPFFLAPIESLWLCSERTYQQDIWRSKVFWKSKTILEFCFVSAQRIKRTYSTESGWRYPDGWPGDRGKHEFLFFQLCLHQRIMEISLRIVTSWILNYQLSFVTQMRFLAFDLRNLNPHKSPGLTTSRRVYWKNTRLKSLRPFVHF